MRNLLIIFTLLAYNLYGQGIEDTKLSELKAPSSPGFTILGIQPTDISRPKDLNSFEASLLNAISNNSTYILPENFAFEATPYWLKPRRVTFAELESKTGFIKRLYRNFSFSIATSKRNNLNDSTLKVSQLGFGLRTLLAQGRLAPNKEVDVASEDLDALFLAQIQFDDIIDHAQAYLDDNPNKINVATPAKNNDMLIKLLKFPYTQLESDNDSGDRIRDVKRIDSSVNANDKVEAMLFLIHKEVVIPYITGKTITDPATAKTFIGDLNIEMNSFINKSKEFRGKVETIRKFREKRVGFICEYAFALGLEAPNNKYKSLRNSRLGMWFTFTHRPEKNTDLELNFLIRYLYTNTELNPVNPNNFDTGGRISYDNGKFIASGEFLYRYVFQTQRTNNALRFDGFDGARWGINLGYRISENIVFNGTLGKTFDNDSINPGGVISVLGVNFGFGKAHITQ